MNTRVVINDRQLLDRIKKNKILPMQAIGNEALSEYKLNFNKHSFDDEPWEKGKKEEGSTLIKSGKLREKMLLTGVNSRGFAIESRLPYSALMNSGGKIHKTDKNIKYFKYMAFIKNKYNVKEKEKWGKMLSVIQRDGFLNIPKRKFLARSENVIRRLNTYMKKYMFT